jgi:hypothetical protein
MEDAESEVADAWMEKHSINCIACGALIDEREAYPTKEGVGMRCEGCFKKKKKYRI